MKKLLFLLILTVLSFNAVAQVTYYRDVDADTYGDPGNSVVSFTGPPAGYVLDGTDCNDTNPTIRPGATEIVGDGIDQNCDACDNCYVDIDNDNYGTNSVITISGLSCSAAPNAASVNTDCNDGNATIRPGAVEIVGDGIDQNCPRLIKNKSCAILFNLT